MRLILIALTYIAYSIIGLTCNAQQITQIIRGRITDKESKQPLVGVTLIIDGSDPIIGTTTDPDGYFKFQELPVGRYNIKVQYIGYESRTIPNVIVNAGKENVLYIDLVESVIKLDEVTINGRTHKAEAINKLSTVSARSFTVDETKRYAGGFNDPSRMAASFAGVSGSPDGDNDLVIRGNSPRGMLWRLEGVEIPNPNHFAEEGATGGPISILNTTTLDNSDFFSGAFPAEYGNAYSGVFDIHLRKGNNEKREYSIQAGIIGTDLSFEGPFSKKSKSSYLFNYRYSSLALLNKTGIKIAGDAVPTFQDLTFKLHFPNTGFGDISIFGLGGISYIEEGEDYWQNKFGTNMGVLGISSVFRLSKSAYIKNIIAVTGSQNIWDYEENDTETDFYYRGEEKFNYKTMKAVSFINKKINTRHNIKTGIIYSRLFFNLFENSYNIDDQKMESEVSEDGGTGMIQAFTNWMYRPMQNVTVNSGVHYMQFLLNNNYSIEPRFGIKWQFHPKQSISGGFGIHSKTETLTNYFAKSEMETGDIIQPNKNIKFGKARHYVIGYDNNLTKNLYLKTEVYFQDLYNVPVEDNDTSSFSALNYGWGYTNIPLANKGTGKNYGVEVTVEKFFSKKYYFLFTSSLYDSKFIAGDKKEYNTRYNGNYIFNLLGGKEFNVGKIKKNGNIIGINFRGIWAGGQRYTPINVEESIEKGYTVRDWTKPYSEQFEDFIRFDLKVSYKRNKKQTTRVWEIDIENVTNNTNVAGDYFNRETGKAETYSQLGFLPVLNYRIEF